MFYKQFEEKIKQTPVLGALLKYLGRKTIVISLRTEIGLIISCLNLSKSNKISIWKLWPSKIHNAFIPNTPQAETDYTGKSVLFIFGGRKDRMSLLIPYLEHLIEQNQLDYIHIWNFARNIQDFNWLNGLENKAKKIFTFRTKTFCFDSFTANQYYVLWKSVYNYYAQPQFKNACFVKCDDDIVYLDTQYFGQFLEKVRNISPKSDYYMVSANVVNNGICAYIQQNQCHLIPESVASFGIPPKYDPLGIFGPEYWDEGRKSQLLHEHFIENRLDFVSKSRRENHKLIDIGTRVSINFIGFRHDTILNYAKVSRFSYSYYRDEHFLTSKLSKSIQKPLLINMSFTVAHLSFASQSKEQNDQELIVKYKGFLNHDSNEINK